MIAWPGLCIVLIVVAFNFLGDALRDAFEVRLRKR
jgi:peptide/nickel transport system permease protein